MKKVFFAFVAASIVVLTACNNKPADNAAATTVDTTSVKTAVTATAPATDSTKTMTDSTATTSTTTATAPTGK